jgi:cytochrome c556
MQKKMSSSGIATVVALFGVAITALAQSGAPADAIHTRQKGLKDLGESFKLVRDQLRAGSPDMAAIKAAGENIKKTSNAMATWFPRGTGTEVGVKTAALPSIWEDPAGYDKARTNFVAAAAKFADITASGDKAAIQAGVGPMGGACRGCHDKFRLKED